jgi:tRNA threonylcarbamoyladenosine biosynthesis protein TsaE
MKRPAEARIQRTRDAEQVTRSPEETRRLAEAFVKTLAASAVVALHGELGSGKTCFVQGMARGLGIVEPVTSPTFIVVNEYAGARRLHHVDLYRLSGPEEVLALGFEEYLDREGITVVEWAERAGDLIPPTAIHVHFRTLDDPAQRAIAIRRPD